MFFVITICAPANAFVFRQFPASATLFELVVLSLAVDLVQLLVNFIFYAWRRQIDVKSTLTMTLFVAPGAILGGLLRNDVDYIVVLFVSGASLLVSTVYCALSRWFDRYKRPVMVVWPDSSGAGAAVSSVRSVSDVMSQPYDSVNSYSDLSVNDDDDNAAAPGARVAVSSSNNSRAASDVASFERSPIVSSGVMAEVRHASSGSVPSASTQKYYDRTLNSRNGTIFRYTFGRPYDGILPALLCGFAQGLVGGGASEFAMALFVARCGLPFQGTRQHCV